MKRTAAALAALALGATAIVSSASAAEAAAFGYVNCASQGTMKSISQAWKTSSTRYSVSSWMTGFLYLDGGQTTINPIYQSINGRWLSYAGTQTMTGFNSTAGVNVTQQWVKKSQIGTGTAHQWTITCSHTLYPNGSTLADPARVVQNY